jgi:NAD+ kinase
MDIRCIGIIAKSSNPYAQAKARSMAVDLQAKGYTVSVDSQAAAGGMEACSAALPVIAQKCQLLIVLGGDGTLLSVARETPSETLILGINMGTLGFLTPHPEYKADALVREVLAGDYKVELRNKLAVTLHQPTVGDKTAFVLNDAVIAKAAMARIIELKIAVEGKPLTRMRADGLIIATPTGSTAYNLAANGPILAPEAAAVVLAPICPHTLTYRPLVLPDRFAIDVELETPSEEVYLTLDGQMGHRIFPGDRIEVRKSDEFASLVVARSYDFFEVLRAKLSWGGG